MSLGETLPKASAEALPMSLPKAWGEPPPNGGVTSRQQGIVSSQFRTYTRN